MTDMGRLSDACGVHVDCPEFKIQGGESIPHCLPCAKIYSAQHLFAIDKSNLPFSSSAQVPSAHVLQSASQHTPFSSLHIAPFIPVPGVAEMLGLGVYPGITHGGRSLAQSRPSG